MGDYKHCPIEKYLETHASPIQQSIAHSCHYKQRVKELEEENEKLKRDKWVRDADRGAGR